jgi:hypothetical protein
MNINTRKNIEAPVHVYILKANQINVSHNMFYAYKLNQYWSVMHCSAIPVNLDSQTNKHKYQNSKAQLDL